MTYTLVVQSEAVVDMQEAFEWHEERRTGLGFELMTEIEVGFERICKHPQHYASINEKYRRLRTNRFPYLVIYEIEDNNIIVIAVKRTSQESTY
jgi:toxin ParE1/3/4